MHAIKSLKSKGFTHTKNPEHPSATLENIGWPVAPRKIAWEFGQSPRET